MGGPAVLCVSGPEGCPLREVGFSEDDGSRSAQGGGRVGVARHGGADQPGTTCGCAGEVGRGDVVFDEDGDTV